MTIAPVQCSIDVRQDPAQAFAMFTGRMIEWWQRGTPGPFPAVAIVVEPRAGGRWFKRDAAGEETQWGQVTAWEPPPPGAHEGRLQLSWQLDHEFRFDPAIDTAVEIVFTPLPEGGTRVTLEHRDLERFGTHAGHVAGRVGQGWPMQLAGFAAFAQTLNKESL